jgi:hypothetical protein
MISNEDFFKYCIKLDDFSSIFYELWRMGKPVDTDKIETAAVTFDRKSGHYIDFLFNKTFWNSIDEYERLFVISHEILHVFLNHGVRSKDFENKSKLNIALDLVVNNLLLNSFGFEKDKLKTLGNKICTIENVFGKDSDISPSKSFEFYLSILKDEEYVMLDDHSFLEGISGKDIKEILEKISESMTDNEKKHIKNIIDSHLQNDDKTAGVGSSNIFVVSKVKYNPKKKWETVIKNWSKKAIDYKLTDQWIKENRRFASLNKNIFLPTEGEVEDYEKSKIDVWFFQDTSGSCQSFIDRFFGAAKSLPKERFNIKMHCFDTKVFETTLESGKLYGFGGTSFSVLEQYIQSYISKKSIPYPRAIFVITDGYGDQINPQYPSRWHWFLSTGYKNLINKDCKIYDLKDYE